MLRLLQGDVGSGKTVVGAARHGARGRGRRPGGADGADRNPRPPAFRDDRAAGRAGRPEGRHPDRPRKGPRARRNAGTGSQRGAIDIVIGTHALFQEAVIFHDLVLAIVDEQHRFGVHQRLAITAKGDAPDMLVMTATPIPRTLVLTAFGDMDVSRLTEKPAGRQADPHRDAAARAAGRAGRADARAPIAEGQKIYWICPLVEESEEIKLMSAEDRFAMLAADLRRRGRPRPRPHEAGATRTRRCAPSRPARRASWSPRR